MTVNQNQQWWSHFTQKTMLKYGNSLSGALFLCRIKYNRGGVNTDVLKIPQLKKKYQKKIPKVDYAIVSQDCVWAKHGRF